MMMIQRILFLILLLVFIVPTIADEDQTMNNTLIPGKHLTGMGNISAISEIQGPGMFGQNLSGIGNETRENLTSTPVTGAGPVESPVSGIDNNTTGMVNQTPAPVYKLSIGSVYEAEYKDPEPMTFTYSGCGS